MKRKQLTLSIFTAAALAAFGAAHAHDVSANSNTGVDASADISSSVSESPSGY